MLSSGWPRAAFALVVLILGGLGVACGPALGPPTPTPVAGDPFAVVRATSQAAYESGKAHLERGELQAALVDLDRAKTNDADNRTDIQQALQQTISSLESLTPQAAPADSGPKIVVATLPAQTPTPAPPQAAPQTPQVVPKTPPGVPPTQAPAPAPTGRPAAGQTPPAPGQTPPRPHSKPTAGAPSAASLLPWRDPQGRFSVAAPADWSRVEQPQALFGAGIVQFVDPSGRAEFDVAVDSASKAVSPELYAASMELAMQNQVPGYASEQMAPGSTSGNPSIRRVFTFTRRDSAGRDQAVRGFQSTVLKGSTPYIISGSAPADQFLQYSPVFDQMVESFRFS